MVGDSSKKAVEGEEQITEMIVQAKESPGVVLKL